MHPYRYRLHRAGICNVWQYDDQVFDFEDGRLLLRGKNGAGKSKALELLLPFLLDGDTKRLDATGGGRTTFRWLMSEGASGVNRQGFLWLELRRVDEQGDEHFQTLGAIVRWSSSTAEARLTYFLTPARIGVDVQLVEGRQPVPVDRLREVLGENALITAARDYRARVGREVFGINDAGRYRNLVHLLYRLRRPTIGDRIEAGQLTTELGEALPPIDDDVLDSVAHNLDDLETVRADLGRLEATHGALSDLMTAYRGYLRGELRRRVHAVDEALARLRSQRRQAGQAEREVAASLNAEEQALDGVRHWELQLRQAAAELRALRESAGYRAVQELAQRRLAVQALQTAARSAQAAAAADRTTLDQLAERVRDETTRFAVAVGQLRDGHRHLRELATEAGLDVGHLGAVPELRHRGAPDDASLEIVQHELAGDEFGAHRARLVAAEEAVRSRRTAVADVEKRLVEAETAATAAVRAEDERDLLDGQQGAAQDRLGQVTVHLVAAGREFASAVQQWSDLLVWADAELTAVREALLTEDPLPAETPDDVRAAAEAAAEPLREAAETLRDTLRAAQLTTDQELAAVRAEHADWLSRTDPEPPRSRFRASGTVPRAGTPLYRLIDFAGHLGTADRAGLEAALESSGLLDALFTRDGTVVDPVSGEIVLRPGTPAPGPSLRDVLVAVSETEAVSAVLASIGWGADSAAGSWVAADGRWRLGVAHGAWTKSEAEFVGAANREALRRRTIADLESRIKVLAAESSGLAERIAEVEQRRRDLVAVLRALPDGAGLRAAWTRRDEAEEAVGRLARQVADARRRARELRGAADDRRAHAESAAAAHLLPTDRSRLALIEQRLRQLAADVPRQARDVERFTGQLRPYEDLIARHGTAVGQAARTADDAQVAADEHLSAEQELAVLERSLGVEPAEILRQENTAEHRVRTAEQELPPARRGYAERRDDRVRASGARDLARERLTEFEQAALEAGTALPRVLTLPGVRPALDLPAELPSEAATGTPPERIRHLDGLAAQLRGALGKPAQDLGENALHQRYTDVRSRLPGGFDLIWEDRDGVKVVEISDDIGRHPVAAATARLGAELEQKRAAVADRERHAFERFLLGELGDALSRQIRSAEALVAAMNSTLAEVRTSHGLGARLVWALRDDADADTRGAVGLLRTPLELRTRDNNDRLREALARRVEDARRSDPSAGYAVHLRAALDYRSWFGFAVKVTDQARPDRERTLSARTAMSQGEQRVVSYLVLFAAAAAHFTSVGEVYPAAPRLILLDDAFAKVDEPTHGRLLGLLVDLDLDAVLTSERLWGCFPEVPSLGIYECLRDPTQPGVATLHFRWDGHRRTVEAT
ncbi:TIGR02680 family protein [Actinoplanes sichuanensis]|uniref:TIGR02680 family protein n=1 Tax=Actinoplanes sichuanensis TaxID=512349 RepID=A0ABW4A295_9ACTN|nr:TIGR02680 family protein [Actinoplanes sichuanensis]BEL01940.1 TIGR02680 family protein [Actinoplanes sichuanensis]